MKLNDQICKNAKPKDKAYKLTDGGGLYLEVTPIPLAVILLFIGITTLPALWELFSVKSSSEFFNLVGVLLLPVGATGLTYIGYRSTKKRKS